MLNISILVQDIAYNNSTHVIDFQKDYQKHICVCEFPNDNNWQCERFCFSNLSLYSTMSVTFSN